MLGIAIYTTENHSRKGDAVDLHMHAHIPLYNTNFILGRTDIIEKTYGTKNRQSFP